MANKTEPWGETTAAIVGGVIAGVFVVIFDKVLLLEKLTEHVPLLPRAFFIVLMVTAAVLGFRYYVILGGADERHGSEERQRYDALRQGLSQGGMPTIVYNRWLRIHSKELTNSSAMPGARTAHGSPARCISKPMATLDRARI
jgi:hypothetical protein